VVELQEVARTPHGHAQEHEACPHPDEDACPRDKLRPASVKGQACNPGALQKVAPVDRLVEGADSAALKHCPEAPLPERRGLEHLEGLIELPVQILALEDPRRIDHQDGKAPEIRHAAGAHQEDRAPCRKRRLAVLKPKRPEHRGPARWLRRIGILQFQRVKEAQDLGHAIPRTGDRLSALWRNRQEEDPAVALGEVARQAPEAARIAAHVAQHAFDHGCHHDVSLHGVLKALHVHPGVAHGVLVEAAIEVQVPGGRADARHQHPSDANSSMTRRMARCKMGSILQRSMDDSPLAHMP